MRRSSRFIGLDSPSLHPAQWLARCPSTVFQMHLSTSRHCDAPDEALDDHPDELFKRRIRGTLRAHLAESGKSLSWCRAKCRHGDSRGVHPFYVSSSLGLFVALNLISWPLRIAVDCVCFQ